jgi:hypothetical protein
MNMTGQAPGGKKKHLAVHGMTGQPFPQQGGGQQMAYQPGFSQNSVAGNMRGMAGPQQGGGQQLGNSQDMMGRGPLFENRLGGLAPQFSKPYGQGGPPPRLPNSYGGPQSMGTAPAFGGQQPQGFGGGQQLNSFRPYQMSQNGYGRAPQGNFGMMQGMGQQMGVLAGGMGQQMQQPQFGAQMGALGQQLMRQQPQFGAGWGAVAGMGQGMAQPQLSAMQGFGQQMLQQNPMAQHAGAQQRMMQGMGQGMLQQNPMAQHAGAAQQMMRGVQGMQNPMAQHAGAMRGMQDQMQNQQAIAANGESAVNDFYKQLMASPDYQGGPPQQQMAYR